MKREALSTRTKVVFDERLLRSMKPGEAVFLQKLINVDDNPATPRDGDFFLCTCNFLANANWPKSRQHAYMQKLQAAGFVDIRRKKCPQFGRAALRWVRIRYELISLQEDVSTNDDVVNQYMMMPKYRTLSKKKAEVEIIHRRTPGTATRSRGRCRGDGRELPMIEEPIVATEVPVNRGTAVTPEHLRYAERLRAQLVQRGICSPYQRASWAKQLALCEAEQGDRFRPVFDWYCSLPDGRTDMKWVSQALSAVGFRHKFPSLVSQWEKAGHSAVRVGPEAARICRSLLHDHIWPSDTSALPVAVQRSWAAYREWLTPIALAARDNRRGDVPGFSRWLSKVLGGAEHFTHVWFVRVHKRVQKWADWHGDFEPLLFRPDHADFLGRLRSEAAAYGARDPGGFVVRFLEQVRRQGG